MCFCYYYFTSSFLTTFTKFHLFFAIFPPGPPPPDLHLTLFVILLRTDISTILMIFMLCLVIFDTCFLILRIITFVVITLIFNSDTFCSIWFFDMCCCFLLLFFTAVFCYIPTWSPLSCSLAIHTIIVQTDQFCPLRTSTSWTPLPHEPFCPSSFSAPRAFLPLELFCPLSHSTPYTWLCTFFLRSLGLRHNFYIQVTITIYTYSIQHIYTPPISLLITDLIIFEKHFLWYLFNTFKCRSHFYLLS